MSNNNDKQSDKEQALLDRAKRGTDKDSGDIQRILHEATHTGAGGFPDFTTKNGLIEMFDITAFPESKKGDKKHIFDSAADNQTKGRMELRYDNISIDNLRRSFKNHWQKHLESLDKYTGKKGEAMFFVNYPERGIFTVENIDKPIPPREAINGYRLSRDKELLDYIYGYKEKVKYVVIDYSDCGEWFAVDDIPTIKKKYPSNYNFIATGLSIEYSEVVPIIL